MVDTEQLIPEYFFERSFGFKTVMVAVGAALLFTSSLLRPQYPIVWTIPFVGGAVVEWLITATVYVEQNQIEETAVQARRDIAQAVREIEEIQREVEETQREINKTKDDIFSFVSDSQGIGVKNSIEDRLSKVENTLGASRGTAGRETLPRRISELERKINRLEKDRSRF